MTNGKQPIMKFKLYLSVVLVALASLAAAGQQPPPVFRSTVDIVAVDVTVIDDRGRQVPDLAVEDFTLTVDGQPRRVVSAQYVALSTQLSQKAPRPATYSTNEGATPGRLIILVVDQGNIRTGAGRQAMHAAGVLLDRLSPQDRVALATIPGPGPKIDFTTNHAVVKDALTKIYGQSDYDFGPYNIGLVEAQAFERSDRLVMDRTIQRECMRDGGLEQGCPERVEMEARQMATAIRTRALASLRGLDEIVAVYKLTDAPKTIVLISEGLLIQDLMSEVSDLANAVTGARTSIYVLHLETPRFDATMGELPPTPTADAEAQLEGLETLAGMARGSLYKLIGTGEIAFERIVREISGYYLLGFEPLAADRNGRPHKIQVAVRRRGLTIRARREFSVPLVATRARTDEDVLAEGLRAPFVTAEVPLRVATFTLHEPTSQRMRVVMTAEIDRDMQGPTDISVGYSLLDPRGRLTISDFKSVQLAPRAGRPGPLHYEGVMIVDPGLYTLKFGVVDKSGRRGTVEHPVRATLTRMSERDLVAGDLMVAPASQPGPSADPTIREDAIATYLELYSNKTALLKGAAVTVEIASDEEGPAMLRQPARVSDVGDGYRRVAQAMVQTALLPPGEYLARATVALAGRPVGHLTRAFRVAPPEPGGTAATTAGVRAGTPPFRIESVLAAPVVRVVLDQVVEAAPAAAASAAVSAAIQRAREGKFDESPAPAGEVTPELAPAFLRGLGYLSRRELEPAAAQFRAALRLSSEFLPAALYLGACYAAGGRDQEAVGAWQTFLITGSDMLVVYSLLADAYLRLNDSAQAIDVLKEAVERWPDDQDLRWRLASAHVAAGQTAESLALIESYLERRPDHHEALFLVLRMLYEAHASGRPIGQPAALRQKFDRYAQQYAAAKGPEQPIVQQWARFIAAIKP